MILRHTWLTAAIERYGYDMSAVRWRVVGHVVTLLRHESAICQPLLIGYAIRYVTLATLRERYEERHY